MVPHTARLDRSGRLVLPAAIRYELELREGDEVVFLAAPPGEVRLVPRREAVRRSQAVVRRYIPADQSLVDDLVRARRADAAQESRDGAQRHKR